MLKLQADFGKKQELYIVKSSEKGIFWSLCIWKDKTEEHTDTDRLLFTEVLV